MHLAQVNIGRMKAPLDDPSMSGFVSRLADLNALADGSPGFVWRLQDGEGNGNTYLRPFDDDRLILNMSVWESVEQLRAYTYNTAHAEILRQRHAWFEKLDRMVVALWWIPVGHIPTVDEAKQRLASLDANGPTPFAFTFRTIFPVPQGVVITREVSAAVGDCELTHLDRVPIDVEVARAQHGAYEQALAAAGYTVDRLASGGDMPDSVFVEDIAIVFDEMAILTRPGAESRRREMPAIAAALARYRPLRAIEPPATIDGGDVLVAGRRVFVGRSSRTNDAAILQMRNILSPLGYGVSAVEVRGCLHLKSAVTALGDDRLLVNREWIDVSPFDGVTLVDVDPGEPSAANVLRLADRLVVAGEFPRTADRIAALGLRVERVAASELAKAEGAVTCCSLIIPGAAL